MSDNRKFNNAQSQKLEPLEYYDMICEIESITGLFNNGWKIRKNKRGEEKYNELKNNPGLIVTAIGNKNKGKSFLLQKICKKKLPRGFSVTTVGLSISFPESFENDIIILDTCGFESPLLELDDTNEYQLKIKNTKIKNENYETMLNKSKESYLKDPKNEKLKEEYFEAKNNFINQIDQSDMNSQLSDFSNERRITDYFLQSFIIEKANILLVVLGKMTCQDQFFLNKIKKIIKNNMYSNYTKKVIVIHNLFNFEDIKEVEDYIRDTLKKSLTFNVNEMAIRNINSNNKSNSFENYFEEIIPDAPNLKIVHLIYTEDGSEAGKYYNDSTISYIRNCIQAKADYKKFDVVQNLKDFFYGISSTIINEEINKKNYVFNNDLNLIKLNKSFTLKKLMGSFLDDSIGSSRYIPEYFEKVNIEKKLYSIIICCPGTGKITYYNVAYDTYYTNVTIEGEKANEINYDNNKIILGKRLSCGPFKIFIKINKMEEHAYIDKTMERPINQDGYLICSFKILKEEEF